MSSRINSNICQYWGSTNFFPSIFTSKNSWWKWTAENISITFPFAVIFLWFSSMRFKFCECIIWHDKRKQNERAEKCARLKGKHFWLCSKLFKASKLDYKVMIEFLLATELCESKSKRKTFPGAFLRSNVRSYSKYPRALQSTRAREV